LKARPFALGLGGNLGDVHAALQNCVDSLADDARIYRLKVSCVYSTPPWGDVSGGDFLNAAVSGCWYGEDMELLELCRSLEKASGSPVSKDGCARFMDVDVLFLQGGVSHPELVLPHPRLSLRKFVLIPLSEVWSDVIPGMESSPRELLFNVNDCSSIIFQGTLDGY